MILLCSVLRYGEEEYGIANAARSIAFPKAAKSEITLFSQREMCRIRREALKGAGCELGVLFK